MTNKPQRMRNSATGVGEVGSNQKFCQPRLNRSSMLVSSIKNLPQRFTKQFFQLTNQFSCAPINFLFVIISRTNLVDECDSLKKMPHRGASVVPIVLIRRRCLALLADHSEHDRLIIRIAESVREVHRRWWQRRSVVPGQVIAEY